MRTRYLYSEMRLNFLDFSNIDKIYCTLNRNVIFVPRIFPFVTIISLVILFSSDLYLQNNNNFNNVISAAAAVNYPESAIPSAKGPIIKDPTLEAEVVFKGLTFPTGMAFLGKNDILITEKDTGNVKRIVNGKMLEKPLLDLNVASFGHRGLLGIAISNNTSSSPFDNIGNRSIPISKYVFVYYTAAAITDGDDITEGKQPHGNVVYRYEFVNDKLINPKLLLKLPSSPGAIGNGGKILVGPDNNLYITIGGVGIDGHHTKAQNIQNSTDPDGTSGVLVINQDGKAIKNNSTLGDKDPLNKYYAYGLWNSFGIDFDPKTGKLWDTENGVVFGDEINLVEPGFNSGWSKIDGIWLRGYPMEDTKDQVVSAQEAEKYLVNINGKGKYSEPEFTWFKDVGPTAIKFFNSTMLGKQYENDIFVGDIVNGNLYHFDLDKQRTELLLSINGSLADKVASSYDRIDEIVFGYGFGGITDIKVGFGDEKYLYVLTLDKSQGTIYRIVPNNITTSTTIR
jgi:glucose/arabinose dehydrogenase